MNSCDGATGVQGSSSHPNTDFVGVVDAVNFSKLSKDVVVITNTDENSVGRNNEGLREQDSAANLLSSRLANFGVDITVRLGSDACTEHVTHKFPTISLGCCLESLNWLNATDAVLPGFVSALQVAGKQADGNLDGIKPALDDLLDGRRTLQGALYSFGRVCTGANPSGLSDSCMFDIHVIVDDTTRGIGQPLSIRRASFRVSDPGRFLAWGNSVLSLQQPTASDNPLQGRKRVPFAVAITVHLERGIIPWVIDGVRTDMIARGFDNLRGLQCWLEEISERFCVPMLAEWSEMLAISVEQHMADVAAFKLYRTRAVRRIRRAMRRVMASHNQHSAA